MKKSLLLPVCCLLLHFLSAQQLPIFSQYREYNGLINPASVSTDYMVFGLADQSDRFIKFGGGQRLQWVANENFTVSTSVLNGEGFLNLGNVSLLGGGYFLHDEVDVTKMDGFYGRFAVYLGDSRGAFWGGLGFNAGYVQHSIDLTKLKAYYYDPLLEYANLTASTPDIGVGGFGVYNWNNDKMIIFGLSVPQLLEKKVSFTDDQEFDYKRLRHIYGQLTFIANASHSPDDFGFFEASIWGKFVQGLRPNIDLNLRYQVSSPFWFGLGGNSNGTIHIESGTNLPIGKISNSDSSRNRLKIGYGLDYSFNPSYSSYFGTSHEINLSYFIF